MVLIVASVLLLERLRECSGLLGLEWVKKELVEEMSEIVRMRACVPSEGCADMPLPTTRTRAVGSRH